jgi:hypothetical protein
MYPSENMRKCSVYKIAKEWLAFVRESRALSFKFDEVSCGLNQSQRGTAMSLIIRHKNLFL